MYFIEELQLIVLNPTEGLNVSILSLYRLWGFKTRCQLRL